MGWRFARNTPTFSRNSTAPCSAAWPNFPFLENSSLCPRPLTPTVINGVILLAAAAQSGLFLQTIQLHWDKLTALTSCMLAVAISFGALLFISDISKPQEFIQVWARLHRRVLLDRAAATILCDSKDRGADGHHYPHRLAQKLRTIWPRRPVGWRGSALGPRNYSKASPPRSSRDLPLSSFLLPACSSPSPCLRAPFCGLQKKPSGRLAPSFLPDLSCKCCVHSRMHLDLVPSRLNLGTPSPPGFSPKSALGVAFPDCFQRQSARVDGAIRRRRAVTSNKLDRFDEVRKHAWPCRWWRTFPI